MIIFCDELSNPNYSKIFSISSASDTFTIFLFSYFSLIFSPGSISNELKLYYYLIYCTLLSIKYWWSHEEIVHTFLSSFLSYASGLVFVWWLLIKYFPVGTLDWCVRPYSTLWLGWSVPIFSCTSQLLLYCNHKKLQLMKSLSQLYCEIALVLFSLLNFCLDSITVPL